MDENLKRSIAVGAAAVAGGWGGIIIATRITSRFGLQLGPVATIAGAAVGAMVGASICKKLLVQSDNLEGEFEVQLDEEAA